MHNRLEKVIIKKKRLYTSVGKICSSLSATFASNYRVGVGSIKQIIGTVEEELQCLEW